MDKIKLFIEKVKQKKDAAAIEMRCGVQDILADTRGESQSTTSAGLVIASLVIIAAIILWQTGFMQKFFQWIQSTFDKLTGKVS